MDIKEPFVLNVDHQKLIDLKAFLKLQGILFGLKIAEYHHLN